MRKIFICLISVLVALGAAQAKKMSDLKIYINPGHGGYDSDDRPINLEIFPAGDTLSFWESKSNLYKGLHLYHILDSLGARPYLSRIKNTTADDRSLSGIAQEANNLGVDLFFSIHSNAGESTNFPLTIYRENVIGTPRYPENVTLSNYLWNNLHSSELPYWTRNTPYVVGDLTFYKGIYSNGLGVLRPLYVVGLLSEGQNHEHRPEAYRLLNDDYLWLEAWHFARTVMEFFNTEDRFVKGNVAGIVYDDNNTREKDFKVKFTAHGRDKNAPINGAYVELLDMSGKLVQKRTTDNFYNGVFVFRNVEPGQYKLRVSHSQYHTEETTITVEANKVTYNDMPMVMNRPGNLEVTSFSPAQGSTDVSCSSIIEFTFNYDIDVSEFEKEFKITPEVDGSLRYFDSYKRVQFVPDISFNKTTTYTVTLGAGTRSADRYNPDPTLGGEVNYTFTTRDYDKIELIASYPAQGGTVDYRKPALEFRFDSKLTSTGLTSKIVVKDKNGNTIPYNTRACSYNKLTNGFGNAIMVLNTNLTPGEKYTVTLDELIRNTENLPFGRIEVIEFSAVDNGTEKAGTVIEPFERTDAIFVGDEQESTGLIGKPLFTRSTADKLFGTSSAKLTYTFSTYRQGEAIWNYVQPTDEPTLIENGDKIGLHINGDFNNHELFVALTGGSDTKYFKICDIDFKGWKYFEIPIEGLLDATPYMFSGIKLIQTESPITQNGVFCIDNMILIKDNGAVDDVMKDNVANIEILASDGKVEIKAPGKALTTVYDMLGRIITRTENTNISVSHGQYVIKVQTAEKTVAKRISI